MTKRGFTLIESIIYAALASLLVITCFTLLFNMMRVYANFRSARTLTHSATVGLDRILREIKQASSVDTANSTFNASPGRLKLNTTDSSGNPTTIDFYVRGNVIVAQNGSGVVATTTDEALQITNLIFRNHPTTNSEAVSIELTLTDSRPATARSAKFYGTGVLRGSY